MAQDDRKGTPSVTRSKTPSPSPTDSPSLRDINAPPQPKAPKAQPSEPAPEVSGTPGGEAAEADAAPSEDGAIDAAAGEKAASAALGGVESGGGSGGGTGGGSPPSDDGARLRREIEDAKQALKDAETEFARYEEQRKADEAAAKMVKDYGEEAKKLVSDSRELEQYRIAETKFLESIFPTQAERDAIAEADKEPREEIETLRRDIEKVKKELADKRRDLEAAKKTAAEAKDTVNGLKKPAAPVKDWLKGAGAIREEARKASAAGHYALAYWLVQNGGRLDKTLKSQPRIIEPGKLAGEVRDAAAKQEEADKAVVKLQTQINGDESALQASKVKLAEFERKLDANVRERLAALDPAPAETA